MLQEIEKYYVYALCWPDRIDPKGLLTNEPFYVGKGSGKRARAHLTNELRGENVFKDRTIDKIRRNGLEPIICYFNERMIESDAYDLEEENIKLYGRKCNKSGSLTNIVESGRPPKHSGENHPYYKKVGPTFGIKWSSEQRSKVTGENHWTFGLLNHPNKGKCRKNPTPGLKRNRPIIVTVRDLFLNTEFIDVNLKEWCTINSINYASFRVAVSKGNTYRNRFTYFKKATE